MEELRLPWVLDVVVLGVNLSSFHSASSSSSFYLWHSRLGYVLTPNLKYLISRGFLSYLQIHDILIVVVVNWQSFLLYPLIEVFPPLLHPWFLLICGDPPLLPQKGGPNIMSPLLMIMVDIVGFTNEALVMLILLFVHLLKLNSILLSSVFVVIWVGNIPL